MGHEGLPKDYTPSVTDVEWFLSYWKRDPKYMNQERALDKLFLQLCPNNDNIEDILVKCSALNDFYGTNIFDTFWVADRIYTLHIDDRLHQCDPSLVADIAQVVFPSGSRFLYSFATKYCSRHRPEGYAIYDTYVEKVILSLQDRFNLGCYTHQSLRDYDTFVNAIDLFRMRFGLTGYSYKQIDQYLWQLGKWHFNNSFTYKYFNREEESPFPRDDVRSKFWYGEKIFANQHMEILSWKKEAQCLLANADPRLKALAAKYTPDQFGLIYYISVLYEKWCPYDSWEWILDY